MALTQQYEVTWNSKFKRVRSYTGTSATAINETVGPITSGGVNQPFQLVEIRIMADDTPSDPENFTITLDSGAGATFDQVIYSADLSVTGIPVQNLFDENRVYGPDDKLDIDYANTGTDTVTFEIIVRVPYQI